MHNATFLRKNKVANERVGDRWVWHGTTRTMQIAFSETATIWINAIWLAADAAVSLVYAFKDDRYVAEPKPKNPNACFYPAYYVKIEWRIH